MPSTCEIILVVVVVLGLCAWYYTSVYRPTCAATKNGQTPHTTVETSVTESHTDDNMQGSGGAARSSPINDPSTFSTVNRRAIAANHRTLSLAQAPVDRPQDGAHLRSLPTDVDEHTGGPVVPAGFGGSTNVAVLSNDLFSTFEEAPAGVTAAMWPSNADGDDAEPASTGMLPGGAENARAVESAIIVANKTRLEEDIDGHISLKYGAKSLARQIGAQGGATSHLFSEYFKCENDAKPKLDIERCQGITLLNMPEYHPCFAVIQDALQKERQDAKYVSGVSSMAYREFLTPTY
jgi:hypothetical protein